MHEDGRRYSRRDVLKRGAIATSAVVLGGTAVSGTAAADIGDGRVLDYQLNNINYDRERGEIVSNFVHDASPADNDGVWKGTTEDPIVKDGAVGRAFEFNGDNTATPTSGDWVEVNKPLLDGSTSATIAGWFKADTVNTAGGLFGHRLDLNEERGGLTFRVKDGDFSAYPNDAVELLVNGNGGQTVTVNLDYDDGSWHHIAGVYDGSRAIVYLDGSYMECADYSESLDPYNSFEIGRYKWDDQGDEWYFNGLIDEVRVYNRALSDAEITELYEMRD